MTINLYIDRSVYAKLHFIVLFQYVMQLFGSSQYQPEITKFHINLMVFFRQ